MKTLKFLSAGLGIVVALAFAQSVLAVDLSNVKCPVSGKAVSEDHAVDFNGGKVYFCCDKCPVAFAKAKGKYTAKADHQLALTGQAKQENCPFTGKPIDSTKSVDVDGVTVNFCCAKCEAKAKKMAADKLMSACFGSVPFKKAFKVTAQ